MFNQSHKDSKKDPPALVAKENSENTPTTDHQPSVMGRTNAKQLPIQMRRHNILQMQRLYGNKHVQRLMTPAVQREEDQETETEKQKRLITERAKAIKEIASEWNTFRKDPKSTEAGQAIAQRLAWAGEGLESLVSPNGGPDPALMQHARSEIGGQALQAFMQIISMFKANGNGLAKIMDILSIRATDPGHKYVMSKGAGEGDALVQAIKKVQGSGKLPKTVQEIVSNIKLNFIEITYTNNFGMAWSREYNVNGLSISISFSMDVLKGKASAGQKVGALSLSVDKPTPAMGSIVRYLGSDDFSIILMAEGPGGKTSVAGAGIALNSGKLVQAGKGMGVAEMLSFPLGGEIKPSGLDIKQEMSASFTLIGGGAGTMSGLGEATNYTSEVEPRAVRKKVGPFVASISDFETGADMPADAQAKVSAAVAKLSQWVDAKNEETKHNLEALELLGIHQPYMLDIRIDGYASRVWAGANSNQQRIDNNQELSQQRANNILLMVQQELAYVSTGAELKFSAVGHGPSVYMQRFYDPAQKGGQPTEVDYVLGESDPDPLAGTGNNSDERPGVQNNHPMARIVTMTVMWEGYDVVWEAIASSAGPQEDPNGGNNDGGGGAGGAGGGRPDDGGEGSHG